MREWITGRNPVFETMLARRRHFFQVQVAKGVQEKGRLLDIIGMAQAMHIPVNRIPRQEIETLGGNPQGVALETSPYPYSDLGEILGVAAKRGELPFLLILDVIQDPQNLGTLLRSAETMGIHGVLLPLRQAAGVTASVVHASAGASEHLRIAQTNLAQAIETLKKADVWVIGLEGSSEAVPIEQMRLDGALALVVGSEGEGLRELTRKSCDALVSLPMRGKIGSLNAAAAGTIALYLAARARQK